jgi:hypothetical protein
MFPSLWKPVSAIFVTQLSTTVIYLPSFVFIGKLLWLITILAIESLHFCNRIDNSRTQSRMDKTKIQPKIEVKFSRLMVYLWFIVCVVNSTVISIKYLDYRLMAATLISRQPIWCADSNSNSPSSNTINWCSYPAADATKNSWLAAARLSKPARCGRSFASIHQTLPALEIWLFSGHTTPHRLPHSLP